MTVYRKELNYRNIGPVPQNRAFFSLKSENISGSLICGIIVSLKTAGDSTAILHSLEHGYKDFLNPQVVFRIQSLLKIQEKVNVCTLVGMENMPHILQS